MCSCFGDWWQLRPVGDTAIFKNPCRASGIAQCGLDMFWNHGREAVRNVWEFVQPMRREDSRYKSMLAMCRQGRLNFDTYCLLHGFSTSTRGSSDTVMHKTQVQYGKDVRLVS